jgi:hypothetical protein
MYPLLLIYFKFPTSSYALSWIPTQQPFKKILVDPGIFYGSSSIKFSISFYSKKPTKPSSFSPTETTHIKARFLIKPQDCPSGVSAGQISPQWVLWSCLGFEIFPYFANGAFIRLQWLNVAKKFCLFNTYATPVFSPAYPFWFTPQLPVARAYFIPSVIVLLPLENA